MKIAILSPTRYHQITETLIALLIEHDDVELVAVFYRKISVDRLIKEELKRGLLSLFKKVIAKLVIPQLQRRITGPSKSPRKEIASHFPFIAVQNFNDEYCVKLMLELDLDLVIFSGGGILRRNILAVPKLGTLNCHFGILPYYRGSDPYIWAVLEKKYDQIGSTVHFMDAGIDTGPILKTFKLRTKPRCLHDIQLLLEKEAPSNLNAVVKLLIENEVKPKKQELDVGKTYYIAHHRILLEAEKKFKARP